MTACWPGGGSLSYHLVPQARGEPGCAVCGGGWHTQASGGANLFQSPLLRSLLRECAVGASRIGLQVELLVGGREQSPGGQQGCRSPGRREVCSQFQVRSRQQWGLACDAALWTNNSTVQNSVRKIFISQQRKSLPKIIDRTPKHKYLLHCLNLKKKFNVVFSIFAFTMVQFFYIIRILGLIQIK